MNITLKRLLAFSLCALSSLSFFACGSEDGTGTPDSGKTDETEGLGEDGYYTYDQEKWKEIYDSMVEVNNLSYLPWLYGSVKYTQTYAEDYDAPVYTYFCDGENYVIESEDYAYYHLGDTLAGYYDGAYWKGSFVENGADYTEVADLTICPFEFTFDEVPVLVERRGGVIGITTARPYQYDGQVCSLVSDYVIDDKCRVLSCTIGLDREYEQGAEPYTTITAEYGTVFERRDELVRQFNVGGENSRKVNLVILPGTEYERTYSDTTYKDYELRFFTAAGEFNVYDDPECTVLHDETGEKPKEITVYTDKLWLEYDDPYGNPYTE